MEQKLISYFNYFLNMPLLPFSQPRQQQKYYNVIILSSSHSRFPKIKISLPTSQTMTLSSLYLACLSPQTATTTFVRQSWTNFSKPATHLMLKCVWIVQHKPFRKTTETSTCYIQKSHFYHRGKTCGILSV